MILTKTPLRVSLLGGGSDYPAHFMEHEGAVLGMAINKYIYVGVKPMPPGQIGTNGQPIQFRVQYSRVDDCQTADEVQHPAVRAALKYFNVAEPLEFHVFGDLPGRSGLGGSSAFTVGLLHALCSLLRKPIGDLLTIAREAIPFEQYQIGETVGLQDQIFAAVGGLRYITFSKTVCDVNTPSIPPERLIELEQSLILVYSGSMRDAHVMAKKQVDAAPRNKDVILAMQELALVGKNALQDVSVPVYEIGLLLNESWLLKKMLHPDITNSQIDLLYRKAMRFGAFGGKVCGAGNGGFMLFFIPSERREAFKQNIGMPCVDFQISYQGSKQVQL